MKKIKILCTLCLGLILLGACSTIKQEKSNDSSSIVQQSLTKKEPSKQKKQTTQEVFDELPQEVKIVLFANTVDSRVKEYPYLKGLSLDYEMDNEKHLYLQLTSHTGTGHPIYKLQIANEGITPKQGVMYKGVSGYETVDVDQQTISKEKIVKEYEANKALYDRSAKQVSRSKELKTLFNEQMATLTSDKKPSISTSSTETIQDVQPSEEELLTYFTRYILSDIGVTDEFTKQQAHYGVDELGQPMIRYGGGQGVYTSIEGNKICYKGYSFGGVSSNGTVEKTEQFSAYYNSETGEHGLF